MALTLLEEFMNNLHPFVYLLQDHKSKEMSFTAKIQYIGPSKGLLYIRKGELELTEDNAKKLLRKSFHLLNIGYIDNSFNPITIATECIKNGLGPILKDIGTFGRAGGDEEVPNSIIAKNLD